jgi:hypothetical protein
MVNATLRPLYLWKENPVPPVQEDGRAPGPVWTVAKNFAPAGIPSPDRPIPSESLYQLRYLGPRAVKVFT